MRGIWARRRKTCETSYAGWNGRDFRCRDNPTDGETETARRERGSSACVIRVAGSLRWLLRLAAVLVMPFVTWRAAETCGWSRMSLRLRFKRGRSGPAPRSSGAERKGGNFSGWQRRWLGADAPGRCAVDVLSAASHLSYYPPLLEHMPQSRRGNSSQLRTRDGVDPFPPPGTRPEHLHPSSM